MNREIKFRVWDKEWRKYHKVAAVFFRSNGKVSGIHMFPPNGIGAAVVTSPYRSGDFLEELMQFTGLNDKHGKGIYDGDIVRYDGEHLARVVWERGGFMFKFCDGIEHPSPCFWHEPTDQPITEVVGNIYENPELLSAA